MHVKVRSFLLPREIDQNHFLPLRVLIFQYIEYRYLFIVPYRFLMLIQAWVWYIIIGITIYAPIIYTAPCVMFLMRADTLCGQVGEIESFGPCEMASSRSIGECHLGPKILEVHKGTET